MRHPVLRSRLIAAASLAACLAVLHGGELQSARAIESLPPSISDKDFWALSEQLSEPNGSFQSDNLISNEMQLSTVAAALAQRVKPGGVYLGVGPEQNFHYIAAIRPKIAFINDIRRGNLHMHLMYKALFELSADRAEFVSRLFTKPRPPGLNTKSTAADLMNAYWDITTSSADVYKANLQAIVNHLTKTHGFPLSSEDLAGVEYVYHAFYWFGPAINYSSSTSGQTGGRTTYADLMMATDQSGAEWGYLASEDKFTFLKGLHTKNLIVPVVGDFAGPKALRAIGAFIRKHEAIVSAFYLSNVESYLTRNGVWPGFCANVATMPLDEQSVFIRPSLAGRAMVFFNTASPTGGRAVTPPQIVYSSPATAAGGRGSPFGAMAQETAACK
jgi:hypothetical protein